MLLTPALVAVVLSATATPKVEAFHAVDIAGGIEATVNPGPTSVKIDADDAALKLIEVTVSGETLKVQWKSGSRVDGMKAKVAITNPVIDGVEGSGGSQISGALPAAKKCRVGGSGGTRVNVKLECETLAVDFSGGARFEATGAAQRISVNASGGVEMYLGKLKAANVAVDASGGTQVHVQATAELKASISGGCQLYVAGKPPVRKVDASGGSRVVDE